MTTRTFTRQELENLTPDQIAEAMASLDNVVMPDVDAEPKNLQQVVSRSDPYGNDFKLETTVQIFSEAGYWPVYHRHTGVSSIIMKNLLPAKLAERDDSGRLVWTTDFRDIPEGLPHKSTFPCWLNPKHALNDAAREMGFGECKQMSPTAMDAEFHTKKKHKRAFDAFEKEELKTKEAKTDEWQQTSMSAITSAALGTQAPMQSEAVCVGCGESFFALNLEAVQAKLGVHMRSCEPYRDLSGDTAFTGQRVAADGTVFTTGTPVTLNEPAVGAVPDDSLNDNIDTEITAPFDGKITGVTITTPSMVRKKCDHCDFVSEATSQVGAGSRLRGHIRKEHPDAD